MRLLVVLLPVMVLACGGGQAPSRPPADAVLVLDGADPSLSIWVDGVFVADHGAARGGVALTPGVHLIELRQSGYHTRYERLELAAGERRTLEVSLVPDLD